jgi:hypothetical protein
MADGTYAVRRRARQQWRALVKRAACEWHGRFGVLPAPRAWVFIVGCYNSGTTLLHELLAQHPDVGSMPDEGQFFQDQLIVPREVGLRRMWTADPQRFRMAEGDGAGIDVTRLKRQWGARFNDAARPVLLEKSPPNAARTRWLNAHFEHAHFIGIVRDGRAVAEGLRRKVGHDLADAASQWATSNEVMLADFEHLPRQRIVRYEDVAREPGRVVAELLQFLALPPLADVGESREWRIHEQQSSVTNMNERSLQRLTADDLAAIDAAAGAMLRRLGYGPTC